MVNWRFGAFPKLPYSTMQQLNLDWILDRIRRFLPDNGTKGQVLTRTKDGAAWQDVSAVAGSVNSVNGKTGDVVLTASDVGALPSSYQAPVTSVNGQTGAVQLSIPDSTSDLTNDSGFVTAAQAAAAAPVKSVNGQTGAVVIPTGGNVDSVNGQTGAVVLDAADVGALPDSVEIKTIHITVPYTAPANGNASANMKRIIDAQMPAGYRFLAYSGYSTNYQRVFIINLLYKDNNFSLFLSSMNTTSVSSNFDCDVMITNLEE